MIKHTFAICAYKESAYLEACIKSLKRQTVKSDILMVTSTPNDFIRELAEKYNIPLFINEGESGIVQDWNFAYEQVKTPYLTIAHQDDLYFSDYARSVIMMMEQAKHPLIYFSNYAEIRNGKKVIKNKLLQIKRILLSPLRIRCLQSSRFVRRRILSLGSPICCPSVAFAKDNLPKPVFKVGFRSDEDWEAWEMISRLKGSFLYDPKVQMGHRIHRESETSLILNDNARSSEDYIMFHKFWPKPIVPILVKLYSTSEKSNDV